MSKKFVNAVRLDAPLLCTFEANHRYDKEWKTHFISFYTTETRPQLDGQQSRPISEELTICLNTKKEAKEFLKVIKQALEKMK